MHEARGGEASGIHNITVSTNAEGSNVHEHASSSLVACILGMMFNKCISSDCLLKSGDIAE